MNRKLLLFLILGLILTFTGCTVVEGEVKDRIVSPENKNIPITGKWEATYIYDEEFIHIDDEEKLKELNIEAYDIEAYFSNTGVAIGEKFTEFPSFRMKNVLAYDYLSENYRITPKDLEVDKERVDVITVLNENTYLFDFARVSDEMFLVKNNDVFYIMERVAEKVNEEEVARYIQVQKDVLRAKGASSEELQSGFLVGFKIPTYDNRSNNIDWTYKTVWINSHSGEVKSVYELDKLLVPRRNGFAEIEKERDYSGGIVNDKINVIPLYTMENGASSNNITSSSEESLIDLDSYELNSELKNILFLGNDYISVENINLNNNEKKTLEVYSLDNINEETPIKLSDLVGEDLSEIFLEGARAEMPLDDSLIPNEHNYGLYRRDGYWSLRGRVNYFQNGEELYRDFNIRAIPPEDMVSYDEQIIPFSMVSYAVHGLVDYFSSPNGELIVALTNQSLTVYPIRNGELSYNNSARIEIPSDATVIMSEWARGRYTESWEEEIINNGGLPIEY